MVLFNEVKETFENQGCITEEEFNIKSRITHENYKYISSCGHNHEICFNNFKID